MALDRGIAVLGMHRSGTSLLAGTLRQYGVHFGKVLDYKFDLNPTGLQESPAVLHMHEDILIKNGGSWHDPRVFPKWDPLHIAVRDLFLESRSDHELWAFKDPRTLLVLDRWLEVVPNLRKIGIFRHPHAVSSSIQNRNGFPLSKGYELWKLYNTQLLEQFEASPFPIIEFTSDSERMHSRLGRAMSDIGLRGDRISSPLYDPTHVRHEATECPPEPVMDLYARLRRCMVQ